MSVIEFETNRLATRRSLTEMSAHPSSESASEETQRYFEELQFKFDFSLRVQGKTQGDRHTTHFHLADSFIHRLEESMPIDSSITQEPRLPFLRMTFTGTPSTREVKFALLPEGEYQDIALIYALVIPGNGRPSLQTYEEPNVITPGNMERYFDLGQKFSRSVTSSDLEIINRAVDLGYKTAIKPVLYTNANGKCEHPGGCDIDDYQQLTIDHFTPRAIAKLQGWTPAMIDHPANLQLLCRSHHDQKDRRTPSIKSQVIFQAQGGMIRYGEHI